MTVCLHTCILALGQGIAAGKNMTGFHSNLLFLI